MGVFNFIEICQRHLSGNSFLKKILWFILIPLSFSFACNNNTMPATDINSTSNKESNLSKEGLCIYATKVDINSDLTYQDINLEDAELIGEPIISYNQIISYDTTLHVMTLSFSQDSLKKRISSSGVYDKTVGIYGQPFIITLDSQKIYGGWFWTPVSSIPCHSVVIVIDDLYDTSKPNQIRIKLGYPDENHYKGIDPRNNKKIVERLIKDNKVK